MEPAGDRTGDVNKGEEPAEDKAADQTSVSSTSVTPRMGLRERGAARPRSGGVHGASASPQSSGRVLRDRATRSVPAWLKDVKSDDEEEPSPETGTSKRRKVSNSRRKKNSEPACSAGGGVAGDSLQATDMEDPKKPAADAQALPSRRPPAQTRAKPQSARASRSAAKPVCKTEPGVENPAGEQPVDNELLWFSGHACKRFRLHRDSVSTR
ncbi:uncharacterized protein LOC133024438 [Limanda limanda]|uniref:uncharacterized protein LOC133024438 n=1 Tax=Limanda limanda TaxID=27771 RepID=UPI0029C80644|nr:uncharacterized protein LOC133024438 [Limanda limanda]XP_060947542.1 uncharacterized protein LOC133024438 [Limanda limanda]